MEKARENALRAALALSLLKGAHDESILIW